MSENLLTDKDDHLKPALDKLEAPCSAAHLGRIPLRTGLLVVVCLASLATGCVSKTLHRQMERVAKDWSLVIRASQVIPVYPLTEDLVPGDIFLVEQTREEQVRQYQDNGFLPLDHHLYRLPLGSDSKYPGTDSQKAGTDSQYNAKEYLNFDAFYSNNPPSKVPLAAFPSYSFEVSRSGGLKLALPIQGINTALGLMNASRAKGNVVLADAQTYGIDEARLFEAVKSWAKMYKDVLSNFVEKPDETKPDETTKYLRVVNRVYLVKSVDVGITRESATGGGATAGPGSALPPIELNNLNKTLSDTLSDSQTPVGSVRFTFANSNSIALKQTFSRALVVGYIGYDVPLLSGGELGTYTSTLQNLTGKAR